MTEQTNTNVNKWLEEEAQALNEQTTFNGEKLPALQFEENRTIKFSIDFSKPFESYNDIENKSVKAIIPVLHNGEKKILWLNKKNPLYKEVVLAGKNGRTDFAVLQTGSKANTKYHLVE